MPLPEALRMAQERELDLVEVAAASVPPVCRLQDYGKFRFDQAKKERESRRGQKGAELREVRMRPGIGEHDMDFKARKMKKFLGEGQKVKISVLFRGRQITHPELAMTLLRRVAESLQEEAKLEKAPSLEGRMMTMILAPSPSKKPSAAPVKEQASA